ncbi:MAG: DUF47 domain-containing protein [Calditrichaeota bacterium]|nr:DUF47 domain-containing protein [Calditrichota bacterium]
MRLDKIIQTIMPHDEHFYALFNDAARNIQAASALLTQLPAASPEARVTIVQQINDLEHAGDSVTHTIFNELSRTFVTPFDPEDIHLLASALDDILDNIDGASRRFALYKIGVCPSGVGELAGTLDQAARELAQGIALLKGFKQPDRLREIIRKVNEYENEADVIFARSVADLFENEMDPIAVIKMKEVLVMLETATDKCEDVADVLDTIMLKHA